MLTRVLRLRPDCVLVALIALGAAPAVGRGDLLFFENLDTSARFNTQNMMHGSSMGLFRDTGGNPGGCVDLRPSLAGVSSSRAAFEHTLASVTLGSLLAEVFVLEADVMFVNGLSGGELVPVLRQGGDIFMPAGPGIAITSIEWTHAAPLAFALTDFRTFEGVAPAPGLARVGFGVRVTGGPIVMPPFAGRYFIDNVSLSVVPGPGRAAVLVATGLVAARRRRSAP